MSSDAGSVRIIRMLSKAAAPHLSLFLADLIFIPERAAAPEWIDVIPNAIAPVDQLWLSVRREAESVVANDPLFGASLSAAILDHSGLGSAVAHQIGERLGKRPDERALFARVTERTLSLLKSLRYCTPRHQRITASRLYRPPGALRAASASQA